MISSVRGRTAGQCPRYDVLDQRLSKAHGRLSPQAALSLLGDVAQANTQWSIVYGMSTGEVHVTLGRQPERAHTFQFDLTPP